MGFFKSLKKLVRHPKKAIKALTPVLGAALGTAIAGPVGGVVGGSLGGASTRGKGNKFKGALQGAGIGAGYAAFAPMIHTAISGPMASGHGLLSSMTGVNQASLLNQLGISSAPKVGGGLGLFGNMGQKGVIPNLISGMGNKVAAGEGLIGGKGLFSSSVGSGLLDAAKKAIPRVKEGLMNQRPGSGGDSESLGYRPVSFSSSSLGGGDFYPGRALTGPGGRELSDSEKKNVSNILGNPNLSSMEKLMLLSQFLGMEEEQYTGKEIGDLTEPVTFKKGGHVVAKTGYIKGKSGGQADDVRTKLPPKSFVLDATTLSLYGDGNSDAGADRFKKEVENRYSDIYRVKNKAPHVKYIDALVSPGEHIIKPEIVTAIGEGDNNKGAKILDNFRKNLREHKGVSKFLPPKSKSFTHYAFKGGAVH